MIRMTPDSFSQRTRCRVAAGDSPTRRASSTFVRSASACSALSSFTSISSSSTAISPLIMKLKGRTNQILCVHERPWRHEQQPPHLYRTDRRRAALGHHGAAVQAGPALAAAGLAHLRALRPGRRNPPAGRPPPAAGRFRPAVLASGAIGYGGSVVLQNAGITRTSVIHAALLIGAVPVLVAIIAAVWHRAVARPVAWAGFALSLAGVALVAGGQAAGRAPPETRWCSCRCLCRPPSRWRRPGCCAAATPLPRPPCSSWGPRSPCCRSRWSPRACPPPRPRWARWRPPRSWQWAARCCPSPCSPTRRAGCPPRWPGRSSTSSRSSVPWRAWCSSATLPAPGSSPGARPSSRASR